MGTCSVPVSSEAEHFTETIVSRTERNRHTNLLFLSDVRRPSEIAQDGKGNSRMFQQKRKCLRHCISIKAIIIIINNEYRSIVNCCTRLEKNSNKTYMMTCPIKLRQFILCPTLRATVKKESNGSITVIRINVAGKSEERDATT